MKAGNAQHIICASKSRPRSQVRGCLSFIICVSFVLKTVQICMKTFIKIFECILIPLELYITLDIFTYIFTELKKLRSKFSSSGNFKYC